MLSAADLGLLEPHLVAVSLKLRDRYENPNKPIEHIVFPDVGIASVVAIQDGSEAEIGLIGAKG